VIRRFVPIESLEALVRRAREARAAARWAEATELYREATRDAVRFGRPFVVVDCLNALGAIAVEVDDLPRAERRFELALRLARSCGYPRGEAGALFDLGAIANTRGDRGKAIGHYRNGRWAYRRARSPAGEARALNSLAMVLADVGRWDAALRCYGKARQLARDMADPGMREPARTRAAEDLVRT
jgi:tetratricopeptide (TPR) repeat protein